MPWEVKIRKIDGSPMGGRDEVVQRIAKAVPAFAWIEEPPLLEQIKDIPDHSFHALLPTWPEDLRAAFARSKLYGVFAGDDFSIQLYGFELQPINAILVEVRGNWNPVPLLAALCLPNGWVAVDDATGQQVELTAEKATGWENFRTYRDHAIRSIKESESEK